MKRGFSLKLVLIGLAVVIPLALLANYLLQPTGVVRGKSSATPLTSEMTPEQQLAQELALSDPRVLDYTAGKRAEVFGVRAVGDHYPASSSACGAAECQQVEIYIFHEHAAVTALVNITAEEVLDVFYQPGVHPGLNKRLADLALEIAINSQEVIDALGFRPTKADMAPVESGLVGTACDTGHLCVGPTFEMGDRILWAIVDLTDEKLAGLNFTRMEPNPPNNAVLFEPEGCPTPGSVNRDGWLMDYEVTGTDGLRIYNVSYNGVTVMTSAKAIEWHADYGASGYTDYTGCGGGGGGFHINPYGETEIKDLADGFEVVQDFRMYNWGNYCNYRYEQHFQFYNDGRFRVVGGAYGKGCGENAIYRPIIRIDVAVAGDDNDTFAVWDGTGWWDQSAENWWSQAAPYTPEGYKWRVMDQSGAGYYMEPGQDNNFGDLGRGDDAFIYVTQHHPSEGDTDLGIIGACCNDNYQQGPHIYLNNETILNENIVVWYVPQFVTDPYNNDGDGYYCWTITGEPHPETYPCFGGPMFVPVGQQPAADIAVDPPSLSATLASGDSVVETFTISNNGQEDLNWFVSEEGANDGPLSLSLVPYVSGLDEPVNIAHAGDGRLFVVEKDGYIRVIDENGNLLPVPFLDIDALVGSSGSEQGLLGLAFHPDYANNGYFYVNYTNNSGNTTISRFAVVNEGGQANPNSEQILLVINQPYSNHNGGDIHFGSDGYLYIGMGDGGSAGDPGNRAQNPQNLLGKMLRIDVDNGNPYAIPPDNPFVNDPNTLDEIWALGLRNPWRFSFDRITNDLFIGDVGQNNWEEIDFQPASSGGGENYGWRCYEGTHAYNTTGCQPYNAYDAPIFEYSHGSGCSVSGGYRYRGAAYPAMVGHYLLADYCSGSFWSLIADGNGGWNSYSYPGLTGFGIVSFGEDNSGELYAANISNGTIYRVTENSNADGISWASVSPISGITAGGQSNEVSVTFDATGLAAGTYNANLIITSNDPDTPEIVYPLTLTVTGNQQTVRSAGIGLWGQQVGSFVVARGIVLVRDNSNAAVPGANVYITWTKPNGSTLDQVGTTAANGTVWFQTGSLTTGDYTITVTDIVKAGYVFDPNNSVLSKTITIP